MWNWNWNWFLKKNKQGLTKQEENEARRLLGDVVADAMDRSGVAALVAKAIPNCGCKRRQEALNNLHKRLLSK